MAWAIRLVTPPEGMSWVRLRNPWHGYWLSQYDADAHEGLGDATFDPDPARALRFGSFDEAKACWWQQSTVLPTRMDGGIEHDNRPLASCSVSIDEID